MKKYLLAFALLFVAAPAYAQCSGVFPVNTLCGNSNITSPLVPTAVVASSYTITFNGTICALGSSCSPTNTTSAMTVGVTSVLSGTTGRVEYNNSGTLGELPVTGTTTVVLAGNPTIASPTITGAFTATGLVTNADLVSPSVTVNGVSCTLGSSCSPSAGTVTLGTTGISGGTNGHIEYNNNGVFGEIATIGSGSVVLATSPTLTTPTLSGATLSGTIAGSPTFSGVNTFSGGALTSTYASGYGLSQLVSYNGTIGLNIQNTNGGSSNASAINFPANDGGQFASIVFNGNANTGGNGGSSLTISNTQDLYIVAGNFVHFNVPPKVPGGSTAVFATNSAITTGAGTGSGVTFTNAPGSSGSTGNPTKWIPINDNGTTRYIPAF